MRNARCRAAAFTLLVALAGCGSSTTAPPLPTATATPSSGSGTTSQRFRIVNASPGTGSIDVYVFPQGAQRPALPTFANVPFGGITPYATQSSGTFAIDVLRAGAVSTETAIASSASVNPSLQLDPGQTNSANGSIVISGTNLNGTRHIQYFLEPYEPPGKSALVVHHASPAANVITLQNPIGIGLYSATKYPPGTAVTTISTDETSQIFALTFIQNPQAVAEPNSATVFGGMFFLTPFPVTPLPATIGFAIGLPSTSTSPNAPLASVIANAALSETANENSPYAGQNQLTNDALQTVPAGTHISEFLIDADQNGNVGLIGTVDP